MNRRAGLVGAAIGLAMTAGACATAHRPAAKPTPTPTPAGGSPAAGVPTAGADPARIDPANFVRTVDNPWFPLVPGQSRVYEGVRDGKAAHEVFIVTAETKTILGVPCVVVRDSLALRAARYGAVAIGLLANGLLGALIAVIAISAFTAIDESRQVTGQPA